VSVSPGALGAALADRLVARHRVRAGARTVIGIAGESGSGKSVTATHLAHVLGERGVPSALLHQDDYFHLPPRANHERRERDLGHVGPAEVNLELLAAHVAAFRAGERAVAVPTVDYPGDRFLTRTVDFSSSGALVVEGTYVLRLPDLDARIFLSATHEESRARREARNRDIVAPFVEQVLAIEHDIIVRQAAGADIVVDGGFRVVGAGPDGERFRPVP
jgi:uridine kinase